MNDQQDNAPPIVNIADLELSPFGHGEQFADAVLPFTNQGGLSSTGK